MSNPVFNVHTSPYVDVFLVILIILIVNLKKKFVAPYNLWDISSLTRDLTRNLGNESVES